jgi:hypothetical protein
MVERLQEEKQEKGQIEIIMKITIVILVEEKKLVEEDLIQVIKIVKRVQEAISLKNRRVVIEYFHSFFLK